MCLVAALGGFLFGYDWVVIGGAKPFYEPYFGITNAPLLQGWAMSSALFGCLLGAVICGALADRAGRKPLLIVSAVLFTVSAFGTGLANDLTTFTLFRVVGGIGIGLASNLSPMYIAEVSPADSRGAMVTINQLTIVIGVLTAQVVNLMIARSVPDEATSNMIAFTWNGTMGWRWMFAAESIPAIAFFSLLFFVPESPRWLVMKGETTRAHNVLRLIGGDQRAKSELAMIEESLRVPEKLATKDSIAHESSMLKLGVFLAVFQQWCGINVIFNYAQEVFSAAGYGVGSIMLNIVITGIVNLLFTFVAIFTVDLVGRRSLLLFGSIGLAITYAALGACYYAQSQGLHVLLLIICAIGFYAMSLAPVVWVVISEIFPNRHRGRSLAIVVFNLWLACTALTFTFPVVNQILGAHGTFWLYGLICTLGSIVVFLKLPETKGLSLEAIEHSIVCESQR